jgi:aldehyde dehydrogenase (NAD+)
MRSNSQQTSSGASSRPGGGAPARYRGLDRIFVAGEWREGQSGKVGTDRSPWTGETLAEIPLADTRDVLDAFASARDAWWDWWARPPTERADVLHRAAHLMEARRDELQDWIVHETGGTRAKAAVEWKLARDVTVEAATFPMRQGGEILAAGVPGKESRVYRDPVGVVTVISPFNFPWQLAMRSVAPALACGNAVVLKPASDTPVSGGTLVGKIFEEAGLPEGLLQVLIGAGRDIGDAIVENPIARVLSFTGSIAVGKHIGEVCGREVRKACLELGGNGPCLVLEDADLDRAADAAVFGKFFHQGQICMAINRLLVDRRVHDAFLDRFVERVRALEVGDMNDPETIIGPIINARQRDAILDRVERTKRAGARVLLQGEPRDLVIPPIVLAGVTNDMPCAREENFGPVAPVISFDGDRDGLRIANDTNAGLSASVFSRDIERASKVAQRLEAGMVHLNDAPVNDEPNTPFGGVKESGLGRFGGRWAMEEFTEARWVSVQHHRRHYPTEPEALQADVP